MNSVDTISILIRLLGMVSSILVVWRVRDWRLAFIPVMLALLVLEALRPGMGEGNSLVLQVAILTVVVTTIFHFMLRQKVRSWGMALLRLTLVLITFHQIALLLVGEPFLGSVRSHSELSLSLVVYLNVLLLESMLTERKQAEEQLRNDAIHDALTGLPNRLLLMEKLQAAHGRAKRHEGYVFAVLFLDLDRFKLLNDSLGHPSGDLFLIESAQRLKACLRSQDTMARLGGDEFVILLEDLPAPGEAERVAERLQKKLAQPYQLDEQTIFPTASIGIAVSTTAYHHPDELLRDADTAMYQAKVAGKGQCRLFASNMHHQATARFQLEADLRRALDDPEQLMVYYQPIVALHSGRITGCEALVRWNHPKRGLVLPAEFIPAAEETDLILPIGHRVLQSACAQNKAWQQAGFPLVRVSVNVSPRQFAQRHFPQTVSGVLRETGLAPRFLELELTESILIGNPEQTSETLRELADLGVRIAIDDFGMGHSSLNYLCRFPLQTLKLGRSFLSGLTKGETGSAEIVTALITLAHTLQVEVTAEGVETHEQLTFLRSLHCTNLQGFLFSQPLPPESFVEFCREGQAACKAACLGDRAETYSSGGVNRVEASRHPQAR